MKYQYVVLLKRNGNRTIDSISIILCLFSVLSFIYEQVLDHQLNYFLCLAAAVILAGLVLNRRKAREKHQLARYKFWLLTAGIGWLGMHYGQWLFVFFVVLAFLEYQAKYPLEVGVDRDEVVINSLIRRRYDWSAFNNVILKDGLLTLDFKTNRLLQKEILDDDEEDDADEEEFNNYCRERLNAAGR